MASIESLGTQEPAGLHISLDEGLLPPGTAADVCEWDVDGDDEVFTTPTAVVWSSGGLVRKFFSLDIEKEPVTRALLAYFPASEDDGVNPDDESDDGDKGGTGTANATTSNNDGPGREEEADKSPGLSRALVVFLKTQVHIYFLSGSSHTIHLPFEVESACAAPRGIIIQRKLRMDSLAPVTLKFPRVPPNSFVSSQLSPIPPTPQTAFSTAAMGRPKTLPLRLSSTLENMWDTPLEKSESNWPRLLCLTDPLLELGLIVAQPARDNNGKRRSLLTSSSSPFLDPAEEILYVEAVELPGGSPRADAGGHDDRLVLAVTINRETSMYSVWRLTYIDVKDQFTHRQQSKAESKASTSRRRSSMQPGLNSGLATPHPPPRAGRDSLGAQLPVKKTRKTASTRKTEKDKADKSSLEMALSLEPDRADEASRRQSRRVSSLLARGDLSASHERSIFAEPAAHLPNPTARRVDSAGSHRGRASAAYAPASASGTYNQTLNSLLEAPVDPLLDELRAGADLEAFNDLGLDDQTFDGLAKEMLFAKIHSVSVDHANIRYSLSDVPSHKQCRVFILPGTPFVADEPGKHDLLVCIQDCVDKRLQILTLHPAAKPASSDAHARARARARATVTVTWGQLHKAQNVVDSCRILDDSLAMMLILSEADSGQRQLSIQAPWSELTTIALPTLYADDRASSNYIGIPRTRKPVDVGAAGFRIAGLYHPGLSGEVDIRDQAGLFHRIRIQLQPSTPLARQALSACRSVLPAVHAEKLLVSWWHVMQWLGDDNGDDGDGDGDGHDGDDGDDSTTIAEREWSALVIVLFVLFLAAGQSNAAGGPRGPTIASAPTYSAPASGAAPPSWMRDPAWRWLLDDHSDEMVQDAENVEPGSHDFVSLHIRCARKYMASPAGIRAVQSPGYLPTAAGSSQDTRRRTAWAVAMALHLFLEEQKLDIMVGEDESPGLADLTAALCQMVRWLRWHSFVQVYELAAHADLDPANDGELSFDPPIPEPADVPCIFTWIQSRLTGQASDSFPTLADVFATAAQKSGKDAPQDGRWEPVTPRTYMFQRFFQLAKLDDSFADAVVAMHRCGFTRPVLDSLPEALLVPLQDIMAKCQPRPPPTWPKELLELVGRSDICKVLDPDSSPPSPRLGPSTSSNNLMLEGVEEELDEDKLEEELDNVRDDEAPVQVMFKDDRRLQEAEAMLSSFKPRVVRLDPDAKWTESEYLERQKELVTTMATSTLATSAGRGLLHYGLRFPLLTEKLQIRGFNLTCVVKPGNVSVTIDKTLFAEEHVNWAFFHQGVAYGLAISPDAKGLDSSWILYNKPAGSEQLSNRHAGFLLALGLNGHLKSVPKWVAFKYLTPKHTMTSIGLLLGLAASRLGTMDSLITRLLSVHVTRMLPPGAAELNLSHHTQTTGIMGMGLLYCATQHRRMSEVMLSEMEHVADAADEKPLRDEGYRLAAGFALGLINLAKGRDLKGLRDMRVTEKLLALATAPKKMELVNVLDRSAAAAVVAVALIYMKTDDAAVARKIDVPDSTPQFDYVRPDVLLLRTVARNLVLWGAVEPTFEWIEARLPAEYRPRHRLDAVERAQTRDLPFFSIMAGLCFAVALRFAGSASPRVRDLLVHYLDQFARIAAAPPLDGFDGRLARANARTCMDLLALSCAAVMAGTGDLAVLRRLRSLHGRDDAHTPYGSHLAAHLAAGALFLGGGTATFGTSDMAVAALLIAFYPVFPAAVQDNRAHLQAFRHFWVLAAEARCLFARDAATGAPVSVPVLIRMKKENRGHDDDNYDYDYDHDHDYDKEPTVLRRTTPCLLPDLADVASLRTDAAAAGLGYWDLDVDLARNPELAASFRNRPTLQLLRRPPRDGVPGAGLRAIGRYETAAPRPVAPEGAAATAQSSGPGPDPGAAPAPAADPLAWIFELDGLKDLSRAERAEALGLLDGGGAGAAEEEGRFGDAPLPPSAVDVRLELERHVDGSSRDKLLGLRLLFEWADRRDALYRQSRRDDGGGGGKQKEAEGQPSSSSSSPWNQVGADDDGGWWMRDSVIDKLKGMVWLAGQEHESS